MWIDLEQRLIADMDKANAEKVVVATGATSGIGYAAALRLVRAGVTAIGIGRSEERCHPRLGKGIIPAALIVLRGMPCGMEGKGS
jgi:NAD(P)-dependent dehydrogenase (short-subunit alcohol dehydrogenase family)